ASSNLPVSLFECAHLRARLLAELPRRRIPDDRVEPVDDVESAPDVLAARECGAYADEAADGGEHCENGERNPHRGRRLVRKDGAVRVRAVPGWLAGVVVVVYVLAARVHYFRLADGLGLKYVRDADSLFGAVVRTVCDRRVNGDVNGLALVVRCGVRLVRL